MANAEATVPWYAVLISSALTGLLAFVLASVKPPEAGKASTPSMGALFTETALFIPHALILFGIVADMFAYHGGYAIASGIGLAAIPLNTMLDYFWMGIAAIFDRSKRLAGYTPPVSVGTQTAGGITNYNGCTVQGFESFKSAYSSQTLVVTASILVFYIFDLAMNKGIMSAVASIVLGLGMFALQASSLSSGNCFPASTGMAVTVLTSIANGIIIGGLFYGIMEAYGSQLLPSKALSSLPKVNLTDLKTDPATGKLTDSSGKSWNILPDGTPIPDTCAELSATDVDSTGRPAAPGTCPGSVTAA